MAKDLLDMTPEELREWEAEQVEKSRQRFAGEPLTGISRTKWAGDYPHLERSGWGFSLVAGEAVRVWTGPRTDALDATVVGLRRAADGGPLVLLVRLPDGAAWALRRHDGQAQWAERTTTRWATSTELRVPVFAWPVPTQTADDADEKVELAGRAQAWSVQSAELDDRR